MANKKWYWVFFLIVVGLIVVAGLTVLIIWLINRSQPEFELVFLDGDGIGDLPQKFAYTRLERGVHTFWWFYPTTQLLPATRPIILWLDGLMGTPPSLLANFGMFGPYDFDLNRREDSWIDEYNLLFVDAPVGTGFSVFNQISQIELSTPEQYAEDLFFTLQSFYSVHEEYQNASLYIFGQGHGAKIAIALADRLQYLREDQYEINLQGVVLGGAMMSPALVMTKLGFYLEELGYIDYNGREYIENLAADTLDLVNTGRNEEAFLNFFSLEESVNERAGAVAVNLHHIVQKLTREPTGDPFGQKKYLQSRFSDVDVFQFMDDTVAPALGIRTRFDALHGDAIEAARFTFMHSDIEIVEDILENTNVNVYIYNGNLDAVSNTPGQLEWVNKLRWSGQSEFLNSSRELVVVNGQLEGYVRQTERLHFYWMNVAGHSVPLDSPVAMRHVLSRIAGY